MCYGCEIGELLRVRLELRKFWPVCVSSRPHVVTSFNVSSLHLSEASNRAKTLHITLVYVWIGACLALARLAFLGLTCYKLL